MMMRSPCRVLGEHNSLCRGVEARGGRLVECTGCLPQPATRGMLCESCSERFEAALDVAVDLVTHMRSIDRAPVVEGPKSATKPGSRAPLSDAPLEADAVWAELHELAFRVDESVVLIGGGTTAAHFGALDSIEHVRDAVENAVTVARSGDVNDLTVAELAVQFYRAVQRALHRYPLEEQVRQLPYARCNPDRGGCGHLTLERRPPLQHLDPITVRCTNPDCGAVYDPLIVEVDLAAYREHLETTFTKGVA